MITLIIISTFGCIVLGVLSLYWGLSRQPSAVTTRLEAMDPSVAGVESPSAFAAVERLAAPINKLIPISAVEAKKIQKQLMHAGYRSPDAATAFRAIQLISFALFPSAMFLLGTFYGVQAINLLMGVVLAAAIGFYLPRYILWKKIKNRQQRLTWGLADALDLLVIAVEAGLGLNAALVRVGEELADVHPDIHSEFEIVNLEIRVGRGREEALRNLADRTGVDDLRSFVALMIQADRFGSSIGKAVRVFSDSLRTKRRQRAEQASQKAALKLLFPLTFFLFPTIILAVLGPALLNLMDIFG
jgi:tight adherence protein C